METFLELGPDAILTALTRATLDTGDGDSAVVEAAVRRNRPETRTLLATLARLFTTGTPLDWDAFYDGTGARRVELPTYAFQHERYWMFGEYGGAADASALGIEAAGHPLLGAVVAAPDSDTVTFTGRLSTAAQGWLADHDVLGAVLLPGTAFVELALYAGEQTEHPVLEELVLQAPLVLPERGALALRVSVAAADELDRRPVRVHSRAQDALPGTPWLLHAEGLLGTQPAAPGPDLTAWPPPSATPVDVTDAYGPLQDRGYAYGPLFQGLKAAWREGDTLFAEVELPEQAHEDAARFAVHPALLDAALHVSLLADGDAGQAVLLPFAWRNVQVHAVGATRLRVRVAPAGGDSIAVHGADAAGHPVFTVEGLVSRPAALPDTAQDPADGALFAVELRPLPDPPAPAAVSAAHWASYDPATPVPDVLVLDTAALTGAAADGDTVARVHEATAGALAAVQQWLAGAEFADSRLVVLTRGAVAADAEGVVDLPGAAVRGLMRSAQAENPGRIVLVDLAAGDSADPAARLAAVLATGEPELVLREGRLSAPRLVRAEPTDGETVRFDGPGAVLVAGATGTLGRLVARHLVAAHGVRRLLLVSRRGPAAPGADTLQAELRELGCEVTLAACDLADPVAARDLLAAHTVSAVVHLAGVLGDTTIASLTPAQLAHSLRPKADAAWNLHTLTQDTGLSAFVLFSSVAGVLGNPGQGNYAAGNAFLDALAAHRRAAGLPGQSLAWGLWATRHSDGTLSGDGMADELGEADLLRMRRSGIGALAPQQGLALLDSAARSDHPLLLPLALDLAALRAAEDLPAQFGALVRRRARTAAGAGTPRPAGAALAALGAKERRRALLELVRNQVAAILGHRSAAEVGAERAFTELGFDSLTALELRNQLTAATGLRLSPTLVFDHPSARAVADHLDTLLAGTTAAVPAATAAATAADGEDPIVIVGMACRYPGGVRSPQDLWNLVADGTDAITAFPANRGWDLDNLYDPQPGTPGKIYVRNGGFLHDADTFDPGFFGMSPNDALTTDPQHRLLLEVAWEALEHAAIDPAALKGTAAGVFAGIMYHDYAGNSAAGSLGSGRLSYTFGLEGPSVTVDTACSSSLVALHLAAQALRSGECPLALVGGVTVMASTETFVEFSRQRGLSPDGRCKSFADTADGAAWAEGVGVIVVERLSDARRNQHEVLAVIRGSAVNQDGASNGLMAPNGPSQERVIRQALANAGLSTADVDTVEAHGTGTALGDPIEAQALLATYGQDREDGKPLWLGSIKSNIGHTQAAAGVAGVIKMVHALRAGVLPKSLHLDAPSTKVDWTAGEIRLLDESRPWPETGERPRRAGVSSFGISGTNAHVILEAPSPEETPHTGEDAPPAATPPAAPAGSGRPLPWILNARDADGIPAQAGRLLALLETLPDTEAADVAYSLATTRTPMEYRAALTVTDTGQGRRELAALAAAAPGAAAALRARDGAPTAFLFSGQGAQRPGMGRQLHAAFPVFAEAFDAAVAEVDRHLDRPLREVVWGEDAELLSRTAYTQTALFAFETALFRLLRSWGMRPDFLAGHSIGELVAAHVSGALTLPDAARLVAARGRLMQALPAGGAMTAVQATEEEVTPLLDAEVSIGAVNGPRSVVVSGSQDAVARIAAHFTALGRKTSRLRVSHAFHSPLMEPMLAEFAETAASLTIAAPDTPIVSNLTGRLLSAGELADPGYWVRHVREAVRFADGIRTLGEAGVTAFVEVGPDAVLAGLGPACLPDTVDAPFVALSRRAHDEEHTLVAGLARAHSAGAGVDWAAFFAGRGARRIALPTYAFRQEHFWALPEHTATDAGTLGLDALDHPLLGAVVPAPGGSALTLTGRPARTAQPWLADHDLLGTVVLPAAALVELALTAGAEAGCDRLASLTLHAPLVLPEQGGVPLHVGVGAPDEEGRRPVSVHARPAAGTQDSWVCHAEGVLETGGEPPAQDLAAWPPPGAEPLAVDDAYDRLSAAGYGYGPLFQGLDAAWRRGEELFARVTLPEEAAPAAARCVLHPALLDAALHLHLLTAAPRETGPLTASAWSGIQVHRSGATALRVRLAPGEQGALSVELADQDGRPVLSAAGVSHRPVTSAELRTGEQAGALYRLAWERTPASAPLPEAAVEIYEVPATDAAGAVAARLAEHTTAGQESRPPLAVLTRRAVAAGPGESPDPDQAAVWGLVRAAQGEHPGRVLLADLDDEPASRQALHTALGSGLSELALRAGTVLAPRLRPATGTEGGRAPRLSGGTVLVTGDTGASGAAVAGHLAAAYGPARLLLTGTGPGTDLPGTVTAADCDPADRTALTALLESLPDDAPLVAVVHLGDRPEGARNLHELTRDRELAAFVLLTSTAALMHGAGQATAAAGAATLGALAVHRHTLGLPATAVALGPWQAGPESDDRRALFATLGLPALDTERGLALLDQALAGGEPYTAAFDLDRAALRSPAAGRLPAVLAALVRTPDRAGARTGPGEAEQLRRTLAGLDEDDRLRLLVETVRTQVAGLLGHATTDAVAADRSFQELGFDSLAVVELRARLGTATGLALPASLAFDFPTSRAVAGYLHSVLEPEADDDRALSAALDQLDAALGAAGARAGDTDQITARLEAVLRRWQDAHALRQTDPEQDFDGASDDELFAALDRELGLS
ncbi:beta-ketoacyl synthase N-terminal-like domain-containing protein [Streptomyces sp. NPDC005423]|uniref:beta-ketoacyl synthase N-terminal-like domain-containing protein n=1 Tax=Streptomyces sp. NPDC005423 TaxID=3155343 RepID=UPI0033B79532